MLLCSGEVHVADSAPVQVITRCRVQLGRTLGVSSGNIIELDDCYLTGAQCAVSDNPELVVPRLARTDLLLTGIAVVVCSQPVSLQSIDDDDRRVRIDHDRLDNVTLEHLKGHGLVVIVEVDLPDTLAREVQLGKA